MGRLESCTEIIKTLFEYVYTGLQLATLYIFNLVNMIGGIKMFKYVLKRIIAMIPKLLVISLLLFGAMEMLPGDPLTRAIPISAYEEMSEYQKEEYREAMGLNDPWYVRYVSWLGGVLQGNFGYSQVTGADIGKTLAGRLPYTIELSACALVVAGILGIFLGFLAATMKNTIFDYGSTTISVLGISFPDFFFGIMFLMIFALKLKILPTGGRMPVGDSRLIARIPYMIMPVMTQAIALLATLTRYTRGAMLDVLNKDYIKTARSKGLREGVVKFKHGFRNALTPVMTLLCMRIPMLVGGSVVIENTFNYPGIGTMTIDALNAGDIPTVMVTLMCSAILALFASTLVDIVVAFFDPRVRLG